MVLQRIFLVSIDRGGIRVVIEQALNSENPSSNPDKADNFYFVKIAWKNKEDSGIG